MAVRFAGTAFVKVDGNSIPLRGNLTVSPMSVERNMLAGQDYVHGYQEYPRVPFIELDMSTLPEVNLEDIERQVNVTVVAQMANQKQYSLNEATCRGGVDINAREGTARVRWEGVSCDEVGL